jgi:hypothetical protein
MIWQFVCNVFEGKTLFWRFEERKKMQNETAFDDWSVCLLCFYRFEERKKHKLKQGLMICQFVLNIFVDKTLFSHIWRRNNAKWDSVQWFVSLLSMFCICNSKTIYICHSLMISNLTPRKWDAWSINILFWWSFMMWLTSSSVKQCWWSSNLCVEWLLSFMVNNFWILIFKFGIWLGLQMKGAFEFLLLIWTKPQPNFLVLF